MPTSVLLEERKTSPCPCCGRLKFEEGRALSVESTSMGGQVTLYSGPVVELFPKETYRRLSEICWCKTTHEFDFLT